MEREESEKDEDAEREDNRGSEGKGRESYKDTERRWQKKLREESRKKTKIQREDDRGSGGRRVGKWQRSREKTIEEAEGGKSEKDKDAERRR